MISDSTNKCPNCGKEFPYYEKVCPYCNTEYVVKRKRHGFITLWLWFCCIFNIATAILMTALTIREGTFLTSSAIITAQIVAIAGFIMLIKWKKSGFYLIVISNVIGLIHNSILLGGYQIPMLVSQSVFSLLILYAILNIKKKDIPYWEAMDIK